MRSLKLQNEGYHAKLLELREAVEGWLAYVPQTFPHYTRHCIRHSDEILAQLSLLLFVDGVPEQPVVKLSAVENYTLAAASYLHDAGMVVSDREKAAIMASDAWKSWIAEGGGSGRWQDIQVFRHGEEPADEEIRAFLADVQVRFLIAEFVRRTHHLRAAEIVAQHQAPLGRFAFDDPVLLRTIADICLAHGLKQHELDDAERYPERRDIRGEKANVRFLAILLRLGDLLDMSNDRACPLLLNAACPLPAESLAHWTQYQRIAHRLTAPDRIEIVAECETQEEHRFLQDWCQWLITEVREGAVLMSRAARHSEWTPPTIGLGKPDSTIVIRPAPSASYFPSTWVFELDRDAVFERLIKDVHGSPEVFIRELIQNALDAMRCKLYQDLLREGLPPPVYPTQVDETRRQRYPLRVFLENREVDNPLSGKKEQRHVVIVDDSGIGMDSEIIRRYLLQVGRSYYTSDEFRRSFRFVATSRFGVGFLSVFGVSDRVTVETYKPSSSRVDGPIRLTLTGPRNYLLTERGTRTTAGTRIEVVMREPMDKGKLTALLKVWCRRVEFPVLIDELGQQTEIQAEKPEDFVYDMPDVTTKGARFVLRAFPVNRPGIEGELYVLGHVDADGESWAKWYWSQYNYPKRHPQATAPTVPDNLTCLHGVTQRVGALDWVPMRGRLDYRRDIRQLTLSRNRSGPLLKAETQMDPEIESRWEEIILEHLRSTPRAKSHESWKYRQKLADLFKLNSFWDSYPEMIRVYINGQEKLLTLNDIRAMPLLTGGYSGRSRPPIPIDSGHPFRRKAATPS
jgi:hypothetical protein